MSAFRIGPYQVLGTLGKGAHSTILHIRRRADARQYALKVVEIKDKEERKFLDQLEHELRVGQMLDHPNLCKVYGLETEKNWLFQVRKAFLLLEYVKGVTLDKAPKLSISHLVQIFVAVASGLVHMHKRGVLHADLKPNNVMLSRMGEVKVIDFGLCWIKGHFKGRLQGTPEYMAPETAKTRRVSEKSDIYNFGATMYRLLTGKLPPAVFTEEGNLPIDEGTFTRLLEPVSKLNPKVPKPLAELVDQCMKYEPELRPERMSVIQGKLDHLADALIRKEEDKLEFLDWGDDY